MGTIEKQVAITLVSILVMGAIGVGYILIEPQWREARGAQMREHSAELGKELFHTQGCVTCHLETGYGMLQGGAGWPLNRSNWAAACRTNISMPETTVHPRSRACFSSSVFSGL